MYFHRGGHTSLIPPPSPFFPYLTFSLFIDYVVNAIRGLVIFYKTYKFDTTLTRN
jgi:hypothetical protein